MKAAAIVPLPFLSFKISVMAGSVIFQEELEVPFVRSLGEFLAWAKSAAFPERGRIDYIAGQIEVDMSPENLHFHGKLKTEIATVLGQITRSEETGELYIDRARLASVEADLSTEPDLVFVSNESLDTGRAQLVPSAGGEEDDYVRIEGSPDLVMEIVSDGSVAKDTRRLPAAYWRAGIREFWLADARGDDVFFRIHRHAASGYEAAPVDEEGFQFSAVFGRHFRLRRYRNRHGRWEYRLDVAARRVAD